ncbi:Elongator complex protein 4 [Lipomyces kononenkoae]|uniref:Elongator complex protein 4 n=1 Tax=Lipomyces kononenkoae TaxID=34357 RepID=A0ACC3SU16_LIPKO
MSFRKRNTPIVSTQTPPKSYQSPSPNEPVSGSQSTRSSTLLPSYITHSTGTASLDKLLLHGGQPLGTSLLVIEDGATDFASVIARCYASQGIANSDVVVAVGTHPRWGLELPAPVEDTKVDKKSPLFPSETARDLKIAWRYKKSSVDSPTLSHEDSLYCRTWNITARLLPPPTLQYIEPTSYSSIISRLNTIITSSGPDKMIRVLLPNFLSPTVYDPATSFAPAELLKFLMSLRALLRTYHSRLSVLITMSTGLFDQAGTGNSVLLPWIETLVDGMIKIVPTPPPDTGGGGGGGGDSTNKYQGFVDVLKVPIVSERGGMVVRKMDYAFKVTKSGIKIEKWGIPVMIDEKTEDKEQVELAF